MVCTVVAGGRASELEGKRLGCSAVLLGDGGGGLAPGQTVGSTAPGVAGRLFSALHRLT